ncbi:MAG: tetratricopeptide repeat protein [Planctomycetota bacterium]
MSWFANKFTTKSLISVFAGILIVATLVLIIVGLRPFRIPRQPEAEPAVAAFDEFVVPKVENPGYLGPQACAECHSERVAEFHNTRHFKAMCVPEVASMPEGFFAGKGDFQMPDTPIHFLMTNENGHFVQKSTDKSTSTTSEIAFVYGAAGGNDEVYFTWHDGKLNELPMVWLGPQKQWGTSPFDRHASGDFSREMTIRCVECHNTWAQHVPGSRNQYSRDHWILGVSCEVCHGPGRAHVDFHRDHPDVKEPHAVVRPAQLSRERRMDLCAQCHSNALKHRGPAFQYRPGEPLDDFYVTLRTKYPEDDHVANQTTYLRQSKCFQSSDSMTCVTCHNPHQPHSPNNAGSQSCRTCHQAEDCIDRLKQPESVRSDCISCHMPEHRKIQVFFRTESDRYVAPVKRYEHRIGVYPLARLAVILESLKKQIDAQSRAEATTITKQLAQLWNEECDERRQSHRLLAAIDACRESLRFDDTPEGQQKLRDLIAVQTALDGDFQAARWHERERRYPQAIEAFQRVLAAKPNHAMAHARLGTAYADVGEKQLSRQHLLSAIKADPDDPYAPAMLGWLAYLDGKHEEALTHYQQADEVEPFNSRINHQMGLALAKLARWPEAIQRQQKAITIDPNDPRPFVALSVALRQSGQRQESVKYARRAAQLTEYKDLEALIGLADAYADDGHWKEAIETTEKGLAIAQTANKQLAAQLRIRLVELRRQGK